MLAFVVLMILPPAATAASGADPSNPSLDQYVESVPTSHGDPPPGGGFSHGHISSTRGQLPASIRHQLATRGGSDATQLQAIATSPAFGAPAAAVRSTTGSGNGTRSRGGDGSRHANDAQPDGAAHRPSGIAAIADSATQGDGSSTGLLLGGVALISALVGGTALVRRRYDTT